MSKKDGKLLVHLHFSDFHIELLKRDIIEETEDELKSDVSSILKATFDDAPPLLMTKSIELNKSALKNYQQQDLEEVRIPRMLKTPWIDNDQAKRNKVRKIPEVSQIVKTSTSKPAKKIKLNPSINFKIGIAPPLLPSMLSMARRNRYRRETPNVMNKTFSIMSHHIRLGHKSPVNIQPNKGLLYIAGGLLSPSFKLRPKKLF